MKTMINYTSDRREKQKVDEIGSFYYSINLILWSRKTTSKYIFFSQQMTLKQNIG